MFGVMQRLIATYTLYQSLVPPVVATFDLLDTKPSVVEKSNAKDLGEIHGHVSFERVTFAYSPAQKILNDVSFEIREERLSLSSGQSAAARRRFSISSCAF